MTAVTGLSGVLLVLGCLVALTSAVGVLRMPDVYTRLHAAGMTDTLGAGFLILGMCFQTGLTLLTLRLLLVYAFLLFTSPIGTHALARATLSGNVEPFRAPIPED